MCNSCVKAMKDVLKEWLPELNIPETKQLHGFHHEGWDICYVLLVLTGPIKCTSQYSVLGRLAYVSHPDSVRDSLKVTPPSPKQLPTFLWPEGRYNPADPTENFLQVQLFVLVYYSFTI